MQRTSRRLSTLLLLAVGVALTAAQISGAQEPLGSEFQINTYTTGYQYNPSVAGRSAGDFVVVWESSPQVGQGGTDVLAQRFGSDGAQVGTEFRVNTYSTGYQYDAQVDMREDGSFVVVWADGARSDYGSNLFGKRFDALGVPLSDEFQVNSTIAGYQNYPRISLDADGKSVVVWWREPAPNPSELSDGIFARRFNAAGNPMGPEFQVDSSTSTSQASPDIDHDDVGNFMIVWHGPNTGTVDINGRFFSSEGIALGSEFHITHDATDEYPRIRHSGNGGFTVVWQNTGEPDGVDGEAGGIFAQRFGADGVFEGTPFQVNTYTTGFQGQPVVAGNDDGALVVAWESYAQHSILNDIVGQRFDHATAVGSEFKVDTYDERGQYSPEIAWLGADEFVVVWHTFTQDGSAQGVFGQRFDATLSQDPICGDVDSSGSVTSADALFALRAAVGIGACEPCVCNADNTGGITAGDALALLLVAVGQPVELVCPACG